jgi:hypothetical protein
VEEKALGFCPDLTPDLIVGVATDGVLVGSQDIAHDLMELRTHKVTHVLNVAYGVPNSFPDVSIALYLHLTLHSRSANLITS